MPWPNRWGLFIGRPAGWVTVIEAFNDIRWRYRWLKLEPKET
jgi:hypothetical protein